MLVPAAPLDGTGGSCCCCCGGDTRPSPFPSSFVLITFPIVIGMRTDETGIGTAATESLAGKKDR
jgi:hypothetical protein